MLKKLPLCTIIALMLQTLTVSAQQYWLPVETPTSKNLNKMAFLDSSRGWIAGDEGIILKTENGGNRWTVLPAFLQTDFLDIQFLNHRLGWALSIKNPSDSGGWFGTYLIKTTTGGLEWDAQSFDSIFFTAVFFLDSMNGWLGGSRGAILRTTNSGSSWFDVDDSASHRFEISRIKFFNHSYGFAIGGAMDIAGIIWRTTDNGANWYSRFVCAEPLHGIHFFDSLHILCVGGDSDFGSGKVETYDGGEHWEYTYFGIWGDARALSFRNDAEGWAPLAFSGTIMYTLDSGQTWTDIFSPDTIPMYDVVFTDERNGFMCGANGRVLKYKGKPNGIEEYSATQFEEKIVLQQNYPNPFNPTTAIRFTMREPRFTSLKIYNVLGGEVATLLENVLLQAGEYTIPYNAENLTAGIYFYHLAVNGFSISKKLVVLK